jgi:hypothetical protein
MRATRFLEARAEPLALAFIPVTRLKIGDTPPGYGRAGARVAATRNPFCGARLAATRLGVPLPRPRAGAGEGLRAGAAHRVMEWRQY